MPVYRLESKQYAHQKGGPPGEAARNKERTIVNKLLLSASALLVLVACGQEQPATQQAPEERVKIW
jgi:hypothetical protein